MEEERARMTNKIELSGEIISDVEFSHETEGIKIYRFELCAKRRSGTCDTLPCYVSEKLVSEIIENNKISLQGSIRTRNIEKDGRSALSIYVFVESVSEYEVDKNNVFLAGFKCNQREKRTTSRGRIIHDFMIANNGPRHVSNYIPCISWEKGADKAEKIKIGEKVAIVGRLQSREYFKKLDDETYETRTAYEVSVSRIEVLEESEE